MTLSEQLRRDEGQRRTAYQDTRGVWTVGVGHNLRVPLSDAAMTQILTDDIEVAERACRTLPIWSGLSEPRQGVLLNMTFNLGFEGLMRFRKMYEALVVHDYARAAEEMLDSDWASQVGARADRLARQMQEDQWT
jgi:lysozyme